MSADFLRALAFVLKWEGGWSDRVDDPGGATMHGITLATYTAWRAAHGYAAPSKAALREITDAEVQEIYYRQYWQAAGCEMLEWPLNAVHFDSAVNCGVGRANHFLSASRDDVGIYVALRRVFYRSLKTFPVFGAGWMRRCDDLLKLAGG